MCNNADARCDRRRPDHCREEVFFDDDIDARGWPDMRQVHQTKIPSAESVGAMFLASVGVGGGLRGDGDDLPTPVARRPEPKTDHKVFYVAVVSGHTVTAAIALPFITTSGNECCKGSAQLCIQELDGRLCCVLPPPVRRRNRRFTRVMLSAKK